MSIKHRTCFMLSTLFPVSSPPTFDAADAAVDLTTSSPVSKLADTCFSYRVGICTLFPVAGPFCTGRGGATREMEG